MVIMEYQASKHGMLILVISLLVGLRMTYVCTVEKIPNNVDYDKVWKFFGLGLN